MCRVLGTPAQGRCPAAPALQHPEFSTLLVQAAASMWLSSLPFFQLAWGQWGLQAPLRLLDPAAAGGGEGITVLPEKSDLSRNVSTIRGSTYHQMGKPTNTVSYWSRSAAGAAMAGRAGWIVHLQRLCGSSGPSSSGPRRYRALPDKSHTDPLQRPLLLLRRAGRDAAGGKKAINILLIAGCSFQCLQFGQIIRPGAEAQFLLRPRWCGCRCGCSPAP